MRNYVLICGLILLQCLPGCSSGPAVEEIVFHSGPFELVGDLKLPEGAGPHPAVVFVHGDGPNSRISGGTYPPLQERMLQAGYATFAWDKPGTGESRGEIDRSRLVEQRAQIVIDAIAVLKRHHSIDSTHIGLWGISQAGYVMPRVLEKSKDVAFMIAISCPGEPGVEQGAYLVASQARCAGLSEEEAAEIERLVGDIERSTSYDEYVRLKTPLLRYDVLADFNMYMGIRPEEEWHPPNFDGEYFFDPMTIVERTTIPVLALFGEKDTQADPYQGVRAYRSALEKAGNKHCRVKLISGVDHNLIISETGCLEERNRRSASGWRNYPPEYLDLLEEWLEGLKGE
ncbi:MAG: alpha/beta fold hydrolase [Candidatus Latescibacteria bacterium]|nr:alpha/beta fold hydrolase [Candidatus Latescibacterota bacterium]NIO56279.1 alpha/beta fold hydrolase [Candidatus Latescibacterota bacterium]